MPELRLKRPVRLQAPAKVNLGLEVLGRRPDGLHEVVTILQAVGPGDIISLVPSDALHYRLLAGETSETDLIARALELARDRLGITLRAEVRLEKHIPSSAGLGGGSSDGGTLLGVLAYLAGMPPERAEEVAGELGADAPFFVRGGTVLARGTGRDLESLPAPIPSWFVVALPALTIPNKTRTLYISLTLSDFSDGAATLEQARRLGVGEPLAPQLMMNAFARPLRAFPQVGATEAALRGAGADVVLPSGAGPSLFSPATDETAARSIAERVPASVARVLVYRTLPEGVNDAALAGLLETGGVELVR